MEKIILITCTELDNIFISTELIQSISTKGLIWGSWKNMVSGMLTGNKVRAFPAGCFTGKTHLHIMSEMAKLGAPNSPLGKYPRKAQHAEELRGGCCSRGDGCPGAACAIAPVCRTDRQP